MFPIKAGDSEALTVFLAWIRLNTTSYICILWSQDAYGNPGGANLYGNHPIYFEHRNGSTHGTLLLYSNGMDIKIGNDGKFRQYHE
ncbi:292dda84-2a98-446a-a142-66efd7e107a0 [Thermothielavioides terrestris]|uniref:292dda84-2a98-446a-a142-66efd7e107a0 n=1 Tax=Thermothielavioides terrestris TaxID=2587410 RepID=A0A3S4C9L4_9PEZI|nr:292dda84-2a98-446a-a142-66efd7e107a0 [Thermothielavioides terrestris]